MARFIGVLFLLFLSAAATASAKEGHHQKGSVTYDARSLMINGKRELLFSGSIHYPRSTPEMWPDLIAKAKEGGLNTIQTYVFWNGHEPSEGQYNFEGRYDLVKFIKLIQQQGMYACLRIGPFIQAEWNHGGFPFWLREVQNITFRSDNEPFKYHMERFTRFIVKMMKDEKLYAPQGGPIILSQIENEYNMVQQAFKDDGPRYVQWAAKMAVSTNTGVPWVMCKQKDAPDPVISVCNGRNCGDDFQAPSNKPLLWTENWTAQYRVFGDPPSQRSAEDLAYSVARFFAKGGSFVNYYMYHGGTNFGRTASSYVSTRYYDEAPLDEYGLLKEPKFGHLRDLHHALKLMKKALLWGTPSTVPLEGGQEARVYEQAGSNVCAAFLTNGNKKADGTVTFRGQEYFLPRHSISILPDCKTVVFNTQSVNSQHNVRTYHPSKEANKNNKWHKYQEIFPSLRKSPIAARRPLELFNLTKDTTDYLWYLTNFRLDETDLPMRHDIRPVLQVISEGHALHAFVNGEYVGSRQGKKQEKTFVFEAPITLNPGTNRIAILGMSVGLPDNGAYLEHKIAGVHFVTILGLNTGTLDLSSNLWRHKVGVLGEQLSIYKQTGTRSVSWTKADSGGTPVTWYKKNFDAPHGREPVIVDMSSMAKGMVWINGESIGRYWVSNLSPLGHPTQTEYHIPRSFLKPKNNLMVVFEESGGNPFGITVSTVSRDNICTLVSELHPGHISSWVREDSQIRSSGDDIKPEAHLQCPNNKVIKVIEFASFGDPKNYCGNFTVGNCHSPQAKIVVQQACLGKTSCVLPVSHEAYQADPACKGTTGTLAVQAKCARGKGLNA